MHCTFSGCCRLAVFTLNHKKKLKKVITLLAILIVTGYFISKDKNLQPGIENMKMARMKICSKLPENGSVSSYSPSAIHAPPNLFT